MKNILITGVSSGIGLALLKQFTNAGYHVLGSVRKESQAAQLKQDFGAKFTPLVFDLTDYQGIENALELVKEKLEKEGLAGIINNAGIALAGPLLHSDIAEHKEQFDVNVWGALKIIQVFSPFLGAVSNFSKQKGRILNISSTSAKIPMPFMGGYSASKAALEVLTDTLRCEFQLYNIPVVTIRPGLIITPIWEKAEAQDANELQHLDYKESGEIFKNYIIKEGKNGMPVAVFAKEVQTIFKKKNPKNTYTIIPKKFQNWILPSLLPRKLLDKHFAQLTKLNR